MPLIQPLLALLLTAVPVSQAPETYARLDFAGSATLPMLPNDRGLVAVEVMIDGQGPFLFGVDTCAQGGGRISAELAMALKLQKGGEITATDGTGLNAQSVPMRVAKQLRIGTATFTDVLLMERSVPRKPGAKGPAVDGILGYGLFRELLLTLDFPAKRLRLERGEVLHGADVVDLVGDGAIARVKVRLRDREEIAHFDSGGDGGLLLPGSMANALPLAGELKVVGRIRTNFNEAEIRGAELNGAVSLGPLIMENPKVAFADIFRTVNFGRQCMQGHVFTIDQANRRMRIASA